MSLPKMSQTQAVKLHQESMAKERQKLDLTTITDDERELWKHTWVNRVCELCGPTDEPTDEQRAIAAEEATEAVISDRHYREIYAKLREARSTKEP